MAFWMGFTGVLTGLLLFTAGFRWGQMRGKPVHPVKPACGGDQVPSEQEKHLREIYNFLHYDGGVMPTAEEGK